MQMGRLIDLLRNKMEGRWRHHRPGCLSLLVGYQLKFFYAYLASKMIYPFDDPALYLTHLDMKTLGSPDVTVI
jgi:hypothetical protein